MYETTMCSTSIVDRLMRFLLINWSRNGYINYDISWIVSIAILGQYNEIIIIVLRCGFDT